MVLQEGRKQDRAGHSTAGRAYFLHTANPRFFSGTPNGPLNLPGVISEHRWVGPQKEKTGMREKSMESGLTAWRIETVFHNSYCLEPVNREKGKQYRTVAHLSSNLARPYQPDLFVFSSS